MNGEDGRGEKCAGDFQAPQNSPEQDRVERMEENIGDMIAGGIHSPSAPFQPKGSRGKRKVIGLIRVEPDLRQSVGGVDERIFRQHDVVVPKKLSMQRWKINREAERNDGESAGQERWQR